MANPLDSIDWGTSLDGRTISYRFYEAGEAAVDFDELFTASSYNAYFEAQILSLFDTLSSITNLKFVEADFSPDLRIMLSDDLYEFDGFMNPPGGLGEGFGVIANASNKLFNQGAYNYSVIVHEVLHGLGLAHPHDNGGRSDVMNGVSQDFDDYGSYELNQGVFTTLSYNGGYPTTTPVPWSDLYGYEIGPMALDIALLQEKYGANMNHAKGNTTYVLDGSNGAGTGWRAIWDAGGKDIISFGGSLDATIDLRAATLKYGVGGGGFVSSADGIVGGYTIANGVVIENATGGSGADKLRGNAADNVLRGARGDDLIIGGNGDDKLVGSKGNDKLKGGSGVDVLKGGSGSDFLKGGRGADILKGSSGDDTIKGGGGADIIKGGSGANVLTGGAGADVFVFTSFGDVDTIVDFASGRDQIRLSANVSDVSIGHDGRDYVISIDKDGDGQFDDGTILSLSVVTYDDIQM